MSGSRKGFVWLSEWSDLTGDLDDARMGRLFRALQRYDADGTDADFSDDPELRMAYRFIRNAIDRQIDRYEEISQKRSEAGKRGRAKQLEQIGQLPTIADKSGQTEQLQAKRANININPNPNINRNPNPSATLPSAHAHEGDDVFDPSEKFGPLHNVCLVPAQHRHLVESYGEAQASAAIDELSCKLAEGSYQTDDHYATLLYWLKYRQRMDAGRVTMSSTQAMPEAERIAQLKDYWQRLTPQEQQQHLDTHGGKHPWDDEQYLKQ